MTTTDPLTVLTLMAHPDDAEILCGGTLWLLKERGWRVHIASATPGDCGTANLRPEEISAIRREEGKRAAALLGGTFHCLEARDLLVFYNEDMVRRATALVRRVRPQLVITHAHADYMPDHEQISLVARAACFNGPIPNAPVSDEAEGAEAGAGPRGPERPISRIPHLYYADPIEGKDPLGEAVEPSLVVDVSSCIERKVDLLASHASQREWLRHHHGMDEYVEAMRRWGTERGKLIASRYAEGFRQHLGHAFPQEDLLAKQLGRLAHPMYPGEREG